MDKHLLRGPHPSDCSGGSYTTAADADGTWRCFHVFCNLLLIQPNTYESASVSVFYDKVVTNGIDIESSMPLSFRFLHSYQAEHTLINTACLVVITGFLTSPIAAQQQKQPG